MDILDWSFLLTLLRIHLAEKINSAIEKFLEIQYLFIYGIR